LVECPDGNLASDRELDEKIIGFSFFKEIFINHPPFSAA